MPGNAAAALFKTFYYMFTRGSLRRGDLNDAFYDAVVAREGRYGCRQRPIWVHLRVAMLWLHVRGLFWVWHHEQYKPV